MEKETKEKYFSKNALNVPNALSAARIGLAVATVSTLSMGMPVVAGALFCTAAATDFVDGALARKYDCVTNLGKSGDALADKILVLPVLALLGITGNIPLAVAYITFVRDSLVGVIKETAGKNKGTVGASQLGRAKTAVTMAGIGGLLLSSGMPPVIGGPLSLLSTGLIWGGTALCVASGAHYVYKYRDVFKKNKSGDAQALEEPTKTKEIQKEETKEPENNPVFNNNLHTVPTQHTKVHTRNNKNSHQRIK